MWLRTAQEINNLPEEFEEIAEGVKQAFYDHSNTPEELPLQLQNALLSELESVLQWKEHTQKVQIPHGTKAALANTIANLSQKQFQGFSQRWKKTAEPLVQTLAQHENTPEPQRYTDFDHYELYEEHTHTQEHKEAEHKEDTQQQLESIQYRFGEELFSITLNVLMNTFSNQNGTQEHNKPNQTLQR